MVAVRHALKGGEGETGGREREGGGGGGGREVADVMALDFKHWLSLECICVVLCTGGVCLQQQLYCSVCLQQERERERDWHVW